MLSYTHYSRQEIGATEQCLYTTANARVFSLFPTLVLRSTTTKKYNQIPNFYIVVLNVSIPEVSLRVKVSLSQHGAQHLLIPIPRG